MENNNMTLRQATNRVEIEGYLKRKELTMKTNSKGINAIYGNLVVLTAPGNEVEINVYCSEKTSSGEMSKAFPGMKTIYNEWVSMADLMNGENPMTSEEAMRNCTKLTTNGQLSRREYYGQTGEFVSRLCVTSNFFNHIDEVINPRASFRVEAYIRTVKEEYKAGETTGRAKVEAWVPVYGGQVLPFDFVVPAELVNDFENLYSAGNTAMFNGDYINCLTRTASHTQGFGRAMETTTRTQELVIMGGEVPYEEGDAKAFSSEAIKKAEMVRMNETIPAMEARSKNASAPSAGLQKAASGFTF